MTRPLPSDYFARIRALDPTRSVFIQAPAGSGKTTLLTQRFLALLGGVMDPGEIVAITFTNAAAAEMRNRILTELERAGQGDPAADPLAVKAMARSEQRGWKLLDQPSLLRITTIDSFCRELALHQSLLSGLGGGLDISQQPDDLYHEAAVRTMRQIDGSNPTLRSALASLLTWRDNNWKDLEQQLVEMLKMRDRWMQGFVFDRTIDESELRDLLERPFATDLRAGLERVSQLLDRVPGVREEMMDLVRIACSNSKEQFRELAERAAFPLLSNDPCGENLQDVYGAMNCVASLLITQEGLFRSRITAKEGFPASDRAENQRMKEWVVTLSAVPDLGPALSALTSLPAAAYTEEEWQIVRSSFEVLSHATGQLRAIFAEVGLVDYIEVAQIALSVLSADTGAAGESAFAISDDISHLLVDEFQDTSRRQHSLLGALISHWSDREGRTAFVVGDPLQSIYLFRNADAELFPRVRDRGLDVPDSPPLLFDPLQLTANFRTAAPVVDRLNQTFSAIFAVDDSGNAREDRASAGGDSGNAVVDIANADEDSVNAGEDWSHLLYVPVTAERKAQKHVDPQFELHLEFIPSLPRARAKDSDSMRERDRAAKAQITQIVELCHSFGPKIEEARLTGNPFRVAVLGRTRKALIPIAEALRSAGVSFRAIDLEPLAGRPEVLDALALARALLNPEDRVAWLGVLRAPWCGLDLHDLYILSSQDNPELQARPIPRLLAERVELLSTPAQLAVRRVLRAIDAAVTLRAADPTSALGSWLEAVWLALGGEACVDRTARANLDLLWAALDSLPDGEQDLLGSALEGTLRDLNAQPDPDSSSQVGIQLMTIHHSKGLEFEVVLVPELHSRFRNQEPKLLSWLERAVTGPGPQATEFLIGPFQSKGVRGGGAAKKWVDKIYHWQELEEMRRLFYVAATRARDQVHFFARPEYKLNAAGAFELVQPNASLLHTAWAAFEPEVRKQFDAWASVRSMTNAPVNPDTMSAPMFDGVFDLAASAEILQMPGSRAADTATEDGKSVGWLRRLPADYAVHLPRLAVNNSGSPSSPALYSRHEGGLRVRILGTQVHRLLEQLAHLRMHSDWDQALDSLPLRLPRVRAEMRSAGISPEDVLKLAAQAMDLALAAAHDPCGRWILDPHPHAASEVRWTGVLDGELRNVQIDRVFCAGLKPGDPGERLAIEPVWWIVDYKSSLAHADRSPEALQQWRTVFAPQLEVYARVLRLIHGPAARIFTGLYYPQISSPDPSGTKSLSSGLSDQTPSNFDYWEPEGETG